MPAAQIVLRRIRLAHVGEHGLWVDEGSSAVTLDEVAALDTGGGGLRIGRGKPLPEGATSLPPAELVHVFNRCPTPPHRDSYRNVHPALN
eukprot:m.370301 g.370301  ORF g.370301 m.370301 type:complete len:90 (-) comp19991_c0_seq2:1897-2166(-)